MRLLMATAAMRLGHLALDFAGSIFFQRAITGDRLEIFVGVGIGKHCPSIDFDQALRDQVSEAPVRRGGMSVILHGKPEVALSRDLPDAPERIGPVPSV